MKPVILTVTLIASVLVGTVGTSAAERPAPFDGAKFFAEQTSRASQ